MLGKPPQRVALILLPEFTMMPMISIIESLRLANQVCEWKHYEWSVHSVDGMPVVASNNLAIMVNGNLSSVPCDSMPIVCGGLDVRNHLDPRLISWLANVGQQFTDVGAACTGVYALAEAGLLDGYNCALHLECVPDFLKLYPEVNVTKKYFEIDRNRFTCAGGITALDMMLAMIADQHGSRLAIAVAESMIHSPIRRRSERQPVSPAVRMGTCHPKLMSVIREMGRLVDQPIKPSKLAGQFDISTRQLERLFQKYVGRSPKRYHLDLRLQKAHMMLMRTGMSVSDISAACGFNSPSHFSRCYKALYSRAPYVERAILGGIPDKNQTFQNLTYS